MRIENLYLLLDYFSLTCMIVNMIPVYRTLQSQENYSISM
jgi:hypothetical protein